MPRLVLMRHAKSDWNDPSLDDFDRPLNKRGRKAAPAMGRWCAAQGLIPQRIICSAALRTRQTLGAVIEFFRGDVDIRLSRRLYEDEAPGYLEAIKQGGDAETLMLIGHNEATHDIAKLLAGRGDDALLTAMHEHYPTAAVAVIDLDAARFADCVPGAGYLAAFMTPARLENR